MRFTVSLCLALGLSQALPAQVEKISIRTLAIAPAEFPQLWGMDSTKPVLLEFSPIQPSEPYQLLRSSPFAIYQGALNDKGKPADPAPTLLKLPEGPGILLLSWIYEGKVKFMPIKDTNSSGKYNDWYVINTTAKSIAIQVGTAKPVAIPPGAHQPLQIDQPAGQGAAIVMASKEDQAWQKFFSTYWPVQGDKRCLVLLVQTGESIEVKQIFEDLARAVPKEK